jgi:radical SAM protein with 4Fe4S-binding SPASM domain
MRQTKLKTESKLAARFGKGTEIALHRALQFLGGGPAYHCTAGDTLITVMPDGTLYPCRRMPINAGNLHQTPLEILYDGPLFRQLRDPAVVASGCEKCTYEKLCRGGLRCLSHAVEGSLSIADPGCWLSSTATPSAAATTASATV